MNYCNYVNGFAIHHCNGGAVAARAKVQAVCDGLAAQKNELPLALNSVLDMIDKALRSENRAADVQKDLDQTKARIKNEKGIGAIGL